MSLDFKVEQLEGRASQEVLSRQIELFSQKDLAAQLLDAVPSFYLILNSNRQLVYLNESLRSFLEIKDARDVYGLRVGEVFRCINVIKGLDGCGTSEFCRTCGALQAMLMGLHGKADVQECRINLERSTETYEFRVHSKPLKLNGEDFSLFAMTDIKLEKRKKSLERVFFHDILNSAGALHGVMMLLKQHGEELDKNISELQNTAYALTQSLIDDIKGQRDISLAENNELRLFPKLIHPQMLIQEVATSYRFHKVGKNKTIVVWESEDAEFPFITDPNVLRRVLGNLVKNALEASTEGDTVSIGWKLEKQKVQFYVHNAQSLPEEVTRNIFRKSFSTKGENRGLGTYSVKLFVERYLQGEVSVSTDPAVGTTVYVRLPLVLKKK